MEGAYWLKADGLREKVIPQIPIRSGQALIAPQESPDNTFSTPSVWKRPVSSPKKEKEERRIGNQKERGIKRKQD